MDCKQQAAKLMKMGYRVTSRSGRHVTRVDRPDWKEHMAIKHSPWSLEEGLDWVHVLGNGAADQYRRVYSKDTLIVSKGVLNHMKNSNHDVVGYKEKGKTDV